VTHLRAAIAWRVLASRTSLQHARETIVRDVASAEASLAAARQLYDSHGIERVHARIDALGPTEFPSLGVEDAGARLESVQNHQAQATTKVGLLQERLSATRPAVDHVVADIGESLPLARSHVEASVAEVDTALKALDVPPEHDAHSAAEALEAAKRQQAELNEKAAAAKVALDSATQARSDADHALAGLDTDIAARCGQLNGIDRVALDERLRTARNDTVFQVTETEGVEPGTARATLDRVRRELERCKSDLDHARGQLHLIAGHVGSERLAQQEDAVEYARA